VGGCLDDKYAKEHAKIVILANRDDARPRSRSKARAMEWRENYRWTERTRIEVCGFKSYRIGGTDDRTH
jgi:hypothetical protein